MTDYKDLDVWKLSVQLAVSIYNLTQSFPKQEAFSLTDQMRRAAVSIASNIAEGSGRASKKDFAHFVSIAVGSARELETQLVIAVQVGYLSDPSCVEVQEQIVRVLKMLYKLRSSLRG
jgi:four helix bundle protein